MNTSILETAGVPVIVDAVRDATKAVGSKVHDIHLPAAHIPKMPSRRKSKFRPRNLLLLGALGAVIAIVVMMRRRKSELPDD